MELRHRAGLLENLHFPCWIVKDAAWFGALQFGAYKEILQGVSLTFAIPTLVITVYLIAADSRRLKRLENLLLGAWLMANTAWMVTELFGVPLSWVSIVMFSLGLMGIIPFLRMLSKSGRGEMPVPEI